MVTHPDEDIDILHNDGVDEKKKAALQDAAESRSASDKKKDTGPEEIDLEEVAWMSSGDNGFFSFLDPENLSDSFVGRLLELGVDEKTIAGFTGYNSQTIGEIKEWYFDRGTITTSAAESQEIVMDVLDGAIDEFGVSAEAMVGTWHHETGYSTSKMTSPTGCKGPFQFSRATMRDMVSKYGDRMSKVLREAGYEEQADLVDQVRMNGGNNSVIDSLSYDSAISTAAATALAADNAKVLGIDASDPNNAGMIYGAHNVGAGSMQKIMRGQGISGFVVDVNTVRSAGRSAGAQMNFFNNVIAKGTSSDLAKGFLAELKGETETDIAANEADAPELKGTYSDAAAAIINDAKHPDRLSSAFIGADKATETPVKTGTDTAAAAKAEGVSTKPGFATATAETPAEKPEPAAAEKPVIDTTARPATYDA